MAPKLTKYKVITVIKRFKFDEIECSVMPIFPEISWSDVKSKLIKKHKTFTAYNVALIIGQILDNINLRDKELDNRLTALEVTDISRHNKRKIWYGYKLTGAGSSLNYLEIRQIQETIKKEFQSKSLNINVKAAVHDDITFVNIKEKKQTKRKAYTAMPIFFALFSGHKYFFCSQKNISTNIAQSMAIALGYNGSKRIKLMGKDLRSLIRLLWNKQQNTLHSEDIQQSLVYEPSRPIISNNGIDYTQSKQRKSYAEKCFHKNPPTLELLVINELEESIQHEAVASLLPYDNIRMSWEFRSHNIVNFLTNLIEKRALPLPLPDYVANFMTVGRNELTLNRD
ncbi:uncharacterized protein LOC114928494 [Nylanderia fulva]|uniref:uncharacterized protein LOC114928494 n=1 Tax=Nylanderia fulva TaxID=613905 RepID=UPI0010FACEDF|nr:uncharacterized protein LOC114928494 [Nylanderia fulva]